MQIYAAKAVGGRSILLKKSNLRNKVSCALCLSFIRIYTIALLIFIGK